MQYERSKRSLGTTVAEFANQCDEIGRGTQLELIALDIEIRLMLGDRVSVNDYLFEFPQHQKQIAQVLSEVSNNFVDTFCPLQDRFGSFPCKVANYEVFREIGRGGMSVVYEAVHENGDRLVALKIPFVKDVCSLREAEISRSLQHPGVISVIDFGSFEKTPYLVMELIDGATLKEMLKISGTLEAREAVRIVETLAKCIQWVHERNIVHFDIKTSNIIMDRDKNPIATDFGLAVSVDEITQRSDDSGYSCGSPRYMAPELFDKSFGLPGTQSDVYSLGVVLYELLTGMTPFVGPLNTLAKQVCNYPPARPTDFGHVRIDSELESICLGALQKHTGERTESMKAFGDQLAGWQRSDRWSADNAPGLRVA